MEVSKRTLIMGMRFRAVDALSIIVPWIYVQLIEGWTQRGDVVDIVLPNFVMDMDQGERKQVIQSLQNLLSADNGQDPPWEVQFLAPQVIRIS